MNIGVYAYGTNRLSAMIAKELEKRHEVSHADCLCEYTKWIDSMIEDEEISEAFLLHPHDSNKEGCYNNIAEFIRRCPQSHFYILAYHENSRSEPRISAIGEFHNATYITEKTADKVFSKIFRL